MADNADVSVLSLAGNPKPQRSKLTTALGSIKHLTSHVVDAGSVVEGAKVAVKAVVDVTSGAMDVTNKIVGSAIGLSVTADTVGGGAAAEIMHARVVNGPEGLGRCLVATRAVRKGAIVMLEKPLLRGEPHAELPPIAAFAAVPDAAAPMPDDLPELGGDAWPRRSTFDTKVMGLLLAFAEADHATRAIFLAELQHEMERPFGRVGPAEESCERAEAALRQRGAPWLAEEWGLAEGVEAEGLLAKLLRICSVSAMPFRGGGALYRTASKLAHACHGANVHYEADPARGVGVFTALRDIQQGDLLTHPYLTMTLSLVSTPLRRRILYCQRSMLCLCRSCTGEDRLRAMPSCTVLATEQQLAAEVLEIYASVDVEKPRSLPTEMRDRLEALRRECEATLGEAHWATQATRRLGLMQEYEQVRRSGDEGALAAWEAQMRLCEAFVDRTLAALESTTEEQPQAEEDGGGAEPVAWDASGEQEDAWEDAGQFLRTAGRPLRVCAWQDALAPESLDALAADAAKLRELVGDETFWISAEETRGRDPLTQALHPVEGPRCTLERLAADVLRFHAARGAPREVTGCEWWVQIRRPDGDKPGIGLHWDSDEVHADGSGEHVPPWIATVSYLGSKGAPTVVFPVAADVHGRGFCAEGGEAESDPSEGRQQYNVLPPPVDEDEERTISRLEATLKQCQLGAAPAPPVHDGGVFLSHPAPGKHLAFDGRLLHGALHELAAGSRGVNTNADNGEPPPRITLLVNLWAGRTPAKLSRLPERVAALLSNVRATRLGDATPAPLSTAKRKTQSLLKDGEWRDLEAAVVEPRRAGGASGGAPPRARLALQVSGLLPSASGDEEGGSSRGRGVQEKAAPALALVKAARVRLPSLRRQRIDAAARELAHAGGDARLVREALLRVLPPSERAMLVEATRRGCGGEGEAELAEDVAEAQEEAVEWVCGVPLLVHLALQGLEACALCALPQLDRHKHVDAADADGFTALHCAANLRLPRLAGALLASGASVDAPTRDVSKLTEPGGRTPLHLAAAAGGSAIVGMLLSAGADRSAEDWQGATPFLLACRRGHHAIAQQLAAAAVAERSRSGGQGGDGAEAEEREEDDGGEEVRMPLEQELRGFELVEGIAVRARAAARLSIDERPKLHEPFTLMAPLLSAVDCASVVAEAEAVAARQGGWCSTRHKNHPTVDLPLHELGVDTYHRLRRRLEAAVLPAMAARYESRPLCVREAFIAKYQGPAKMARAPAAAARPKLSKVGSFSKVPTFSLRKVPSFGKADKAADKEKEKESPTQAGLEMHRDGSLLNCVVLLNPRADFSGGGTAFAPPLDRVLSTQVGECLCSCGQLLHGAAPVTAGTRYVLIAFIDEQQEPPDEEEEEEE